MGVFAIILYEFGCRKCDKQKNFNPHAFYGVFMLIFMSNSEKDKIIAFRDILRPDANANIGLKQNNFSMDHF